MVGLSPTGMNSYRLLISLLGVALIPVAHAGVDLSISADIRLGNVPPPPPPQVVVIEQIGPPGPPPWAPGHWYRRNRAYYYYPGCNVYYRPADRMWFYLEGSNWRAGVQLPSSISIDFGHSVSLTMETDRPYIHHERVVAYYPAGYFTKVKIKGRDNGPHFVDRDKSDHPGKGWGPGKSNRGGKDKSHKGKGRD